MAKIVAIVNQKGGVGKTTTCVNLAAAVAQTGKRVLLCDFDPQANATSGMGVDKTVSNGVYDVIINGVETEKAIVSTPYGDVLPSSKALAGAGVEMIALPERQFLLKQALRQVVERYDFIFIDCPPSLELLTLNALCAANSLLVPVQGEYFALEGLSDLMNTVRLVRRGMNPDLQIEGVLLTMFDGRTNLSIQVAQEIKRFFPGKVYATVIPRKDPLTVYPTTSSWLKINFSFVCCCISSNSCSKPVSPKRRLIFFCCDHTSAFRLVVANAITRHISFILIMSQISFSIVFFINLLLTFNMIPLAGNFAGMYWRAFRLFTVR
mgnify:CR=1 FL=1